MRNCFVPNCDAYCKQHAMTKRMMFSAPKESLEIWKSVLFSKREFREKDRVCERHFEACQILTHWDHVIQGQLHRLEREKPKIEPSAVPSLNLPDRTEALTDTSPTIKRKSRTKRKSPKVNNDSADDNSDPLMEVEVLDDLEIGLIDDAALTKDEVAEQKRLRFVEMLNEIAAIAVPSPLWGIHRDEDNCRFIVFSKFDNTQMQCTKVLRITDDHVMDIRDIRADGLYKSTAHLDEMSIDIIADALRSLDEA